MTTYPLVYILAQRLKNKTQYVPWKFCGEKDLKKIVGPDKKKIKLSAMADIGRIEKDDTLPASKNSLDMIRVACYAHQIHEAIDLAHDCIKKGYEVTINLMAVSKIETKALNEVLELLNQSRVPIIYLVDSFGSFYPGDIVALCKKYRERLPFKAIGAHFHNNQQLAFANTIIAASNGITHLDATLHGIGRGAGNCPMELILPFLENDKYQVRPIIECIEKQILPWKKKKDWGYSIPYMISGKTNQHPKTAIEIMESDKKEDVLDYFDKVFENRP